MPENRADHKCNLRIIGADRGLKKIFWLLRKLRNCSEVALITGETGTGKSLIARHIHCESSRQSEPFVEIPCASLNDNLIESELFGHAKGAFTSASQATVGKLSLAGRGTIFLDEIAELSISAQTRLLHVLQEGTFWPVGSNQCETSRARIIAATNRDVRELVRLGKFREDLYFRLAVLTIHIPPLRDRGEDCFALAESFLGEHAQQMGCAIHFSHMARQQLATHPWPGNVRELKNTITRSVLYQSLDLLPNSHDDFTLEKLEIDNSPLTSLPEYKDESQMMKEALLNTSRMKEASEVLGISRFALYRRMKKNGLKRTVSFQNF